MDEFFKKFPELLKVIFEKISQSDFSSDNPEVKMAKVRLLTQLKDITNEISKLQIKEGTGLSEEQIKILKETIPDPWKV